MKLSEIVTGFLDVRQLGLLLTEDQVGRNLKKAVRFYAGYAEIKSLASQGKKIDASPEIDGQNDVDLSHSEFAIIEPLFKLYCELENATALEASRGQGADPFGRSTAEVQGDIRQYETDMSNMAFMEPFVTI